MNWLEPSKENLLLFHDIQQQELANYTPSIFTPIFMMFFLVLAFCGLGFALKKYLKIRRDAPTLEADSLSIFQAKIDALDPLQAKDDPLYLEKLDQVFREYLTNTYQIPAASMTKEELCHSFRDQQEILEVANALFLPLDKVKFANLQIDEKERLKAFRSLSRLHLLQSQQN